MGTIGRGEDEGVFRDEGEHSDEVLPEVGGAPFFEGEDVRPIVGLTYVDSRATGEEGIG